MRKPSLEDTVWVGQAMEKDPFSRPLLKERSYSCVTQASLRATPVWEGALWEPGFPFSALQAESSAPLCPAQCIINEETSLPVSGQLICSYNHDFKYHMNNSENYFTVVR